MKAISFLLSKANEWKYDIFNVLKVLFKSKLVFDNLEKNILRKKCVIVLNGPTVKTSLMKILSDDTYRDYDFAVSNNFVKSEYYELLKPKYLFLMDRLFWDNEIKNNNNLIYRKECFEDLVKKTNWDINVVCPFQMKYNKTSDEIAKNALINIIYYNLNWLRKGSIKFLTFLLNMGLGTLAPFSVLTIMIQGLMNYGYSEIIVVGADHSWHETIVMNDENILCYKANYNFTNNEIGEKIYPMYDYDNNHTKISDFFLTYHYVFQSYEILQKIATRKEVKIINASERSYIDSFPRMKLKKNDQTIEP